MSTELLIRRARPEDRAAVERVCAHTWPWGDYIPEVWDEWVADEDNALLVGEIDGRVIALGRVVFLPHGQAWFEAMRVDPDYRQRGIAGQFLQHKLGLARARGSRLARLATGSDNAAVHRMMASAGMACIGTYVQWTAGPSDQGLQITFLSPDLIAPAQAFLQASPVLANTKGLYSTEWIWQELSAQRLVELLVAGQMAGILGPDEHLQALAQIHYTPGDERLWIGYADGDPPAVTRLVSAIRAHAARAGAPEINVMLPELPWLRDAFHQAGYGFGEWEGVLWIFEKHLGQETESHTTSGAARSGRPAAADGTGHGW